MSIQCDSNQDQNQLPHCHNNLILRSKNLIVDLFKNNKYNGMSECLLAWFGKAQTKTILNPILAHTVDNEW